MSNAEGDFEQATPRLDARRGRAAFATIEKKSKRRARWPSCLGVELALYDGRPNFSVSCSTKSKAASGRLKKIHPLSGRIGSFAIALSLRLRKTPRDDRKRRLTRRLETCPSHRKRKHRLLRFIDSLRRHEPGKNKGSIL
jgi:hypothetical protein